AVLIPTLRRRMDWATASLAAVLAFGAVNVKQEGFYFTVIVIVAYLVTSIRTQGVPKYLPLVAALAGYGLHKLFLAATQTVQTSDADGIVGRLGELIQPGSVAWEVFARLATNEWLITI